MTAEYIRDWQQPRHAVGREGTGIPAPESALSSWLDAYRQRTSAARKWLMRRSPPRRWAT
ncbi:hypothetical protein [Escherichia coli]|uniref:hypothetical protein n=1 Tax=Escherichia coli TaxID=562 RepID=UPI003D9A9616